MSPAEIEARIADFRAGRITQAELQAFLAGLSDADYQRWASSPERKAPSASGAGASGLSALAPLAVGPAGVAGFLGMAATAAASGGSEGAPLGPTPPDTRRDVGQPGRDLGRIQSQEAAAEAVARFEAAYGGQYIGTPQVQSDGTIIAVLADGSMARFMPVGDTYALAPKELQPGFSGGGGGGGGGFAPQSTMVELDPTTGEIIFIDPNTRQVMRSGQFIEPQGSQITDPRTGNLLVVSPDGTVRDTGQQVGFAEADPNVQQVTDQRTGVTYNVNTRTGERTPLGTFGFADIDPERNFALDEAGVTGFYGGQPTIRSTEETGRNSRAGLEAGTRGFESVNSLAPRLGELALSNAEFSRDVLRTPADWAARAAMSRGENSPFPQVSQADLINMLRDNIGQFNDVLSGFNVPSQYTPGGFSVPTPQAPAAQAPVAPAAVAPVVAAAPAPAGFSAAFGGTPVSQSPANQAALQTAVEAGRSATPAGQPVAASFEAQMAELQRVAAQQQANLAATGRSVDASGTVRRLAGGGFAHPGDVAVVGERGPEVVMDLPDGFAVINEEQLGMDPMKLKAPHAQTGGIFGFSPPRLPVPAGVTQSELDAARNLARPPAVRDVRAGVRPQPLSFGAGFALPTPQLLASLTDDEYSAFRTDLAGENISLDDVEFAVRQRFAPPGGRARARTVGFAA